MFPTPTTLCEHPLSSHRNDAAQEWSAGLYWPGTLAHLPVLHDGVQASPVPTMFTPTIAFEPNKKGLERLLTVHYRALCTFAEGRTHLPTSV